MAVATHTAYLCAQFGCNARVGGDPCSFKLACLPNERYRYRTRFFSNSNGNEQRRKRLVVTAKVRRNLPRRLIAPKRVFEEDPNICPCGGGEGQLKLRYEECCKPYHDGQLTEPDALTLARTRYTAYAKGLVDYIVNTIHPEYPELQAKGVEKLTQELNLMCPRIHFTKFDILEVEGATETQVCVTFRITFTYRVVKQYREILKKKVIFVKEGKRWFFRGPVVLYKPNRLKNKLAEEEIGIFD